MRANHVCWGVLTSAATAAAHDGGAFSGTSADLAMITSNITAVEADATFPAFTSGLEAIHGAVHVCPAPASGRSVFELDLALQVIFPVDLAIGIPQPQGILGLPYGGRFRLAELGRVSPVPGAQNSRSQDAAGYRQDEAQDDPQKYPGPRARAAHHSAHGDLPSLSHQALAVSVGGRPPCGVGPYGLNRDDQ
jgi:hypothetical protein